VPVNAGVAEEPAYGVLPVERLDRPAVRGCWAGVNKDCGRENGGDERPACADVKPVGSHAATVRRRSNGSLSGH
jgi:hypothetical protein